MNANFGAITILTLGLLGSGAAEARHHTQLHARSNVGLGIGAGVSAPTSGNYLPSVAWGFYTDIPLLNTFHISPSTLVYRLDPVDGGIGESATDISLNFKFIVPLRNMDVMSGVTAGLTSTRELKPHVGLTTGVSYNMVSNLDFFANANYRYILNSGDEVHDVQLIVGTLFHFSQ